jgi:hypothetical protein
VVTRQIFIILPASLSLNFDEDCGKDVAIRIFEGGYCKAGNLGKVISGSENFRNNACRILTDASSTGSGSITVMSPARRLSVK